MANINKSTIARLNSKKKDRVLWIVLADSANRAKILPFCNQRYTRNTEKPQALMSASMLNIAVLPI